MQENSNPNSAIPSGLLSTHRKAVSRKILRILGVLVTSLVMALFVFIGIWFLRPNESDAGMPSSIEVWPAVQDGWHNSNTDLIFWRGSFYMIHAKSRYHMGSANATLVLHRSQDAKQWETIKIFDAGDDLRDPKLAVIHGQLFLYVLKNADFEPAPFVTSLATSEDGIQWSEFVDLEPKGWLFWKPESRDQKTWYVTAYWHDHGKSVLLKSNDGKTWTKVSQIHEGSRNDETALIFLADGSMLVTARLEGDRTDWHQGAPNASTLLATSSYPYTKWESTISMTSRLDGPRLFAFDGRTYAIGRFDPEGRDKWYGHSSLFGRKRTSLYRVTESELIRLFDLPSNGDTSYAGSVIKDGFLYVSYYSNNNSHDFPWLMGLVMPTDILIAKIPLRTLDSDQ